MANSNWIDTIGIDPTPIMDEVLNKGLNKYDAAKLVNNLIAVNLGQAPRHFNFSSPLPTPPEDSSKPSFVREFSHQDWVDGESVVQASESADDKGFNWRFNAIGDDLNHLHADTATVFAYLDNLRSAFVEALQDVAAELNRINTDLAGLGTRVLPKTPWHYGIVDAPQFLGVRDLDGGKVTMWQHDNSVFVLPAVNTVGLKDTITQHLSTGSKIVDYAASDPNFTADVGKGLTVAQLTAKYGGNPTKDGRTVGQLLAILPPSAMFKDTPALVDNVVTAEQGYIRSTVGSIDAVGSLTGVTNTGAPISGESLHLLAAAVTDAPENLQSAITAAGVGSAGDIAKLQTKDLTAALTNVGVTLSATQLTQLQVTAKMIAGVVGTSG
ncbi:hypothetical protein [Mycobacterium sp.]|uniref:hypothetical protein n=1 Tax=Mycobacterium sp. TaxID=1785 RepID=UPI003D0EFD91